MFKKSFLILFICGFASAIYPQSYNILNFGAVSDGVIVNTKAIQKAIDSCAKTGGTVYVPAGVFLTGTLELRSNINLHLENGAELKGSPDMADYKKYQSPHATEISHYGVLFASNCENISITGQGAINGNEEAFFEWDKAKTIEWGGTKNTRQKEKFREVSSGIGDGPVVPKDRPRQMIIFSGCKNVQVSNVMIIKSPFWALHFADCDGVTVHGIKLWNSLLTPNSDGIDITSCNNVTISDCDIRAGDDAIAITGYAYHFELPGFRDLRHTSDNICISNCNLQSRSSGIRIGFIDQNSVRNIHISNVNITNSNRGIGIFTRGEGSIENVTISQVTIETRLHTGDWWGNGEPIHISAVPGEKDVKPGKIKNVTFRDVTCTGENGILIYGCKETPIEDIRFENLTFNMIGSKLNATSGGNIDLRGALGDKQLFESELSAFGASNIKNLALNNVTIDWNDADREFFKYAMHINDFTGAKLSGISIIPLSARKSQPAVFLENGQLLQTDLKKEQFHHNNVK